MNAVQVAEKFQLKIKIPGVFFSVLLFVILGTYHSAFSYIALLLSTLLLVCLSEENTLCLMMFLVSFANIFKSAPGAQSFFTYLLLFYVLYSIISKGRWNKKCVTAFVLLVSFLMLQFLISINILRSIKFVANIFLIYYALRIKSRNNHNSVFAWYVLGVVVASSISALNIIPNLSGYIGQKALANTQGQILRFTGLYADPNYYSINLIISLCLIIVLHYQCVLRTSLAIGVSILITFFAIMTFSKSVFLMLVLPLLLCIYINVKKKKRFLLLCLLGGGIVFAGFMFSGKIAILNTVLSRFSADEGLSSLTTGRSDIWKEYLTYFKDSAFTFLFGEGFGASLLNQHAAHNTYIDLIYYLGILGTTLLLITLATLRQKCGAKKTLLNYCVWICILIMYFFLSELFYFDWPFHIIIAVLVSEIRCTNMQRRGEKEHEEIYM